MLGAFYGAARTVPAAATGLPPPVADCSGHGQLLHHYSATELRKALKAIPADVAEYTNCPDVINRALLAELGSLKGGSGGSGGSLLPGWMIAVLAVVVLTGAGTTALAVRNSRRAA